jgi:hypothetical protein
MPFSAAGLSSFFSRERLDSSTPARHALGIEFSTIINPYDQLRAIVQRLQVDGMAFRDQLGLVHPLFRLNLPLGNRDLAVIDNPPSQFLRGFIGGDDGKNFSRTGIQFLHLLKSWIDANGLVRSIIQPASEAEGASRPALDQTTA